MGQGDERGAPEESTRERFVVIGEIAAEVAHELRNVLQVITASAYLARQDPAASSPHIAKIEKNARLAHSIVDDLMSLARGEPAQAEPILLYDVLVAARSELDPDAAVWNDEILPPGVRVRAHAGLAARLFHALYDNAIRVCRPRQPNILTRARQEGDIVVIEVGDDGPGVDPVIATRIFDPLVTGREGGTGLGLALARRIATAHSGALELVASRDVKGATFRIELPARRT